MKVIHALAVSIFPACLAASIASAQTYPNRPITMVVAFPPGGADDATARILQDPMQKALGQPIVVENVGGAGGMIGAAKAARAEPDGYTILLHQDALAAGMTLYPNHTFDAEKGFVPIGHMLLAPAGTPRPIVNKLNAALRTALADAKLRKTFNDGGMDLYPDDQETPEAANALLKSEIKLWGEVVRANHIATE